MRADHVTYRRAASVSLIGLAVQLLLTLLLFVNAYMAGDHAGFTATLYVLLGVPVWLGLALVFDQHRRERIEAFEAEAFAQTDAATSSVFEESAGELRVAAKRLQTMHKVFVPSLSLTTGALLIGLGVWRFLSGREYSGNPEFHGPEGGATLGLGVTFLVAVIGFIVARFVSGMAKQSVWANLSAGSTQAIGASVFALLLAAGAFVKIAGSDFFIRSLPLILPVLMIVLGAEVFLNFLLDLYRPRRSGEFPRPAADSRVLGLLAAPDRIAQSIGEAINYQLGTDVTGNWFYRLLSRRLSLLVLIGLATGWLTTCFAVVAPHQRAIKLRFGELQAADLGPGLHMKLPWPIDRLVVPEFQETDERGKVVRVVRTATGARTLHLGSAPPTAKNEPILWTNEHAQEEGLQIVLAGSGDSTGQDLALVAAEIPVHYVIENVEIYEQLGAPTQRDALLRAIGQRAITRRFATLTMDRVLGTDRQKLADELRSALEAAFAGLNPDANGAPRGAGIRIIFVGMQGAHPPKDAAASFENVVQAIQNKESALESARKSEIQTLTDAVGDVDRARAIFAEIQEYQRLTREGTEESQALQSTKIERMLAEAGGRASKLLADAARERWERHMAARGRAARYGGQVMADSASPNVYRAILYFDMLKSVMQNSRLYVFSDDVPFRADFDLTDQTTAGQNVFQSGDAGTP
ncbi:MAG: hypothetical protein H6811_04775 [Phycisphaeraceae bacterium]|nr:hypothetical protein [Phycisphaeraceae bacterium]